MLIEEVSQWNWIDQRMTRESRGQTNNPVNGVKQKNSVPKGNIENFLEVDIYFLNHFLVENIYQTSWPRQMKGFGVEWCL